jgi:hypothetical protein
MSSCRREPLAVVLVFVATVLGCGWSNRAEVANYREANRQLAAQSRLQLTEIENLKTHTRQIEDQLIAAEEALARLQRPMRAERDDAAVVTASAPLLWKAVPEDPAASGLIPKRDH